MTKARSNATANAAKGDLTVGNGTNLSGVLAVGSNGETIVADSSTSTGLRYQATKSTQQAILNGGFDCWQRGTSFTTTSIYSADRWFTYQVSGSGATWSRQAGSGEFQYAMRVARNNASTNTANISISQSVAIDEATQFAGKTVTLSFYAKAGANFSPTSSLIAVSCYSGTSSTDANRALVAYASGDTAALNTTQAITTTLTRYSFTFTLGATVTQFATFFSMNPTGTAGANDWFEITGIQLEVGSVATTFRRAGGTIQGELAACQRYYYRLATGAVKSVAMGSYYSASYVQLMVKYPVTMRTTPTLDANSGTDYFIAYRNGASDPFNSLTLDTSATTNEMGLLYNASETSGTAGWATSVFTNNAATYVGFGAEL